ncbi:MAG: hypothetical protein IKV10_00855 [Alphaproteobacteria bacterium]|nr:hypothetical protein [Alphaproteobacteria bacterium]
MGKEEKSKRGRKPAWTDAKVEIICKAIENGKSYKDAYTAARISHTAFYAHLNNDVEFLDKVKKAEATYQQWYDSQLVLDCKRSLIELVRGYEWDETTTETMPGKDGKGVITKTKVIHKRAAPSPTAIIFALCNRDPANWQNRVSNDISGKIETENKGAGVSLANVPDSLLSQVIEAINGKQ